MMLEEFLISLDGIFNSLTAEGKKFVWQKYVYSVSFMYNNDLSTVNRGIRNVKKRVTGCV